MDISAPPHSITLPLQALHQWHVELERAFRQAAEPGALAHLVVALTALAPVESVMISLERKNCPPRLLYQHGIPEQHLDAILNRYFSVGYLLDPFCLAVDSGLAQGFYSLAEIAPDDFFDSDYYKTYYLNLGCTEDSYYIVNLDEQSKISVSLFQGMGASCLSADQVNVLRAVEPMVRLFIRQCGYIETLSAQGESAAQTASTAVNQRIQVAMQQFGCDVLTERERESAHMVLRGHSIKSTAREMGISPETVRMHRKNLYLKLGINSQSELFAQFIEWLQKA
ncbi:helix-turn-helix transcriptional regulator [Pseudomonas frederiksbergensis]|uniref:Helix-turn-helix transcriptional regulator n=1 Tax=Pseudomonas frederiksbergensis TaxID=104087 RepID=A0A423KHS2_9PSED|nr:LuxR C-terminal-related transcriptional regulator [Pseudomonas frederiksbergensis]RON52667.1 helix-turn-helix transcriptional regulator [Pseudomonas frederiksbergensis]